MCTIGERIALLRELHNLKQKDVAEAIGVTKATMSKYENNVNIPNADILCKLADILKASTDFLVGRTDIISSYDIKYNGEYSKDKLIAIIEKLNQENQIRIYERAILLLTQQTE